MDKMKLKECKHCKGQSPTCLYCNDEGTFNEFDNYTKFRSHDSPKKIVEPTKPQLKLVLILAGKNFFRELKNDQIYIQNIDRQDDNPKKLKIIITKIRKRIIAWKNECRNIDKKENYLKVELHIKQLKSVENSLRNIYQLSIRNSKRKKKPNSTKALLGSPKISKKLKTSGKVTLYQKYPKIFDELRRTIGKGR